MKNRSKIQRLGGQEQPRKALCMGRGLEPDSIYLGSSPARHGGEAEGEVRRLPRFGRVGGEVSRDASARLLAGRQGRFYLSLSASAYAPTSR